MKERRCISSPGCRDVEREAISPDEYWKAGDDYGVDLGDEDYSYQSDEDDEPLEYASELASVRGSDLGDRDDSASEEEDYVVTQLGTLLEQDGKCSNEDASHKREIDKGKSSPDGQQRKMSIDDRFEDPSLAKEPGSPSSSACS